MTNFRLLIGVSLLIHCISAQWQVPNQFSQQDFLFNPMTSNTPATFQQKLIQIRQRIDRPRQQLQQRSYFPRITAEDGDENDEEATPEDVDVMQPQIQQQRIVPLKSHGLLPVIIGMVPTACGRKMYYPRNEFCYKNRPYNREKYGTCGPRLYRKESHFCFNGQTFNKIRKGICGDGIYDKLTQICLNHRVRNICAGEIFDPSTHFCYERIYNREFYSMCGKRVYKKSTHLCVRGKIYAKRKAAAHFDTIYTPTDLSLWGRSIQQQYYQNKKAKMFPPYRRSNYHTWKSVALSRVNVNGDRKNLVPQQSNLMTCGFQKYEPKTHFCYKGKITKRCGGAIAYNPTNLLCFRNFLYTKSLYDMCGNEMFNKFSQSCINGHVLQRDRKQFEKLFMDYGTSSAQRDQKEQQEIYNLSKQLEAKRREFRERHQQQQQQQQQQRQQQQQQQQQQQRRQQLPQQRTTCNLGMKFNKRSHFCYNGKLYNRSINAVCGGVLYNRTSQRCLGGQLFPTMDLNKPTYYLGGELGMNNNAMNPYNFG